MCVAFPNKNTIASLVGRYNSKLKKKFKKFWIYCWFPGDGRNCTNINICESNPCEHNCEPFYNDYNCSCFDGYTLLNATHCVDVNECGTGNPCSELPQTVCVNAVGNYR